jgi:hypothetical protein
LVGQRQRVEHEDDNRQPRDEENRVVNVQSERPDLRFDIVLTDLVIGLNDIRRPLGRRNTLIC